MIRRVACLLALASLPLAALAGDPLSYSFVDGQYLKSTVKTTGSTKDDKFEGYRAGLNLSVYKFVYFTGGADKRRAQKYRQGNQYAGFGAHTQKNLSSFLDLFGELTYERTLYNDVTHTPAAFDDSDEGYGVGGGVRLPYDNFEFTAYGKYLDMGKSDRVASRQAKFKDDEIKVTGDNYGASVLLQMTPYLGLTVDYRHLDRNFKGSGSASALDVKDRYDEFLLGFRAYFATDIDRYRRRGGFFGSGE